MRAERWQAGQVRVDLAFPLSEVGNRRGLASRGWCRLTCVLEGPLWALGGEVTVDGLGGTGEQLVGDCHAPGSRCQPLGGGSGTLGLRG